jgi:SAM-dependent methyltransferase
MSDGAEFFQGNNLRIGFYDLLFSHAANLAGEEDFYRTFTAGAESVLEAACGSGRLFGSLSAPGRLLAGFDASEDLLRQAHRAYPAIPVSCQRLESFAFSRCFARIVLSYYGLSYILQPQGRISCFQRIAAHLTPDGRALVHVPAAAMLERDIPAAELAELHGKRRIQTPDFTGTLTHRLEGNRLEPDGIRAMQYHFTLLDANGATLAEERATMRYAVLDAGDIEALAAMAGLRVLELRAGFAEEVDSELIVVLGRA